MNKYFVEMRVSFSAEIEAESQSQAEDLAYTGWGENSDALIQYDGVYDIKVEDMGEICSECEEVQDNCECDEDEDESEAE